MIRVTYDRNNLALAVSGHAGFDEVGRDIVCAAVTAIEYTLVAAMEGTRGFCAIMPQKNDGGADVLSFSARLGRRRARLLFDAAAGGIRLISEAYPENVRITVI